MLPLGEPRLRSSTKYRGSLEFRRRISRSANRRSLRRGGNVARRSHRTATTVTSTTETALSVRNYLTPRDLRLSQSGGDDEMCPQSSSEQLNEEICSLRVYSERTSDALNDMNIRVKEV